MDTYEILIRPVVTERTTKQISEGKYTFIVHKDANTSLVKKQLKRHLMLR